MTKILTALGLALALAAPVQAEDVRIGWTAWSDAEFVTKLAERVLEDRMDQDVELVQTDIAPQYQGVASGDIDVMLMSWLPGTHSDYMDKVGADIVDLGILYGYARLGWAVPTYIPESELSSIEDLKKDNVREQLDGTITGIDPGAGLTRLSKEAIEEYGLDDYELQISSGAGMTAALERAVNRDEWIVVTGWSPHWKFGAYDLRYLEDPKGVLGSYERVHALAREGFYQENPEAALFLARMHLDLDELQAAMFQAQETSYEEAVDEFIANNGDLIDYWVTGKMD
ncbi:MULTISPECIES: glycine betaine ABC transporter substrate-binding protein [unclassified Wenzhouxiangella]|uniref:glycine betaine ABC transporter substrate-binding protein n=1 Tax=unclassified Wenzhouxiangella TaxID=2613841 RepID=UPI000E32A148|nr:MULTISPECIES: glycine betaine ABC transporter substrate-binding protein [unclassified Wenzhouxiangella]RFF28812.1 glycine betaine ABC transporter substrate-binding protein [Wenzhouxiangella sp. 15181]RFP68211.1 glycine betaine ABC transporter substrate-binding protein [Wenzhouxiangella sp. 15190]